MTQDTDWLSQKQDSSNVNREPGISPALGHGRVEYAAALVKAETLASIVLSVFPDDFMNYFTAVRKALPDSSCNFPPGVVDPTPFLLH